MSHQGPSTLPSTPDPSKTRWVVRFPENSSDSTSYCYLPSFGPRTDQETHVFTLERRFDEDGQEIARTSERASEHLGSTSAVPHESLQAPTFSSKMKTRITQPALKIYPVHNDVAHKGQVNLPLANTYGGRLRLAKASLGEAPDVDIQSVSVNGAVRSEEAAASAEDPITPPTDDSSKVLPQPEVAVRDAALTTTKHLKRKKQRNKDLDCVWYMDSGATSIPSPDLQVPPKGIELGALYIHKIKSSGDGGTDMPYSVQIWMWDMAQDGSEAWVAQSTLPEHPEQHELRLSFSPTFEPGWTTESTRRRQRGSLNITVITS
ncbi:hypothetical protein FOMPIDRAFT_1020737 [Fomitopsis schrenkii]|uniref:Uncharacterized protein n=1 Tax=Fomitopsis schrenkii TaxID=2126942 RepID=S8F2A9_FOMSC|nr:hypothetical protein FOMPIDRAFT_1020737 [Fomitopsis schrenkii]